MDSETKCPTFTAAGYPSDETLDAIGQWNPNDIPGLLDFLKAAWCDTGKVRGNGPAYEFITGGWSGNEDLIAVFQSNWVAWSLAWWRSERGGLFEFRIPENQMRPKETPRAK